MQIKMTEADIRTAVTEYLQSMGIKSSVQQLDFSMTRGEEGLVAYIEVGDTAPVKPTVVKDTLADVQKTTVEDSQEEDEPEKAEDGGLQTDGSDEPEFERKEEEEEETPSSGKSLFA